MSVTQRWTWLNCTNQKCLFRIFSLWLTINIFTYFCTLESFLCLIVTICFKIALEIIWKYLLPNLESCLNFIFKISSSFPAVLNLFCITIKFKFQEREGFYSKSNKTSIYLCLPPVALLIHCLTHSFKIERRLISFENQSHLTFHFKILIFLPFHYVFQVYCWD